MLILSFEWNVVLGAVSDPVVWKFIMTWWWAGLPRSTRNAGKLPRAHFCYLKPFLVFVSCYLLTATLPLLFPLPLILPLFSSSASNLSHFSLDVFISPAFMLP